MNLYRILLFGLCTTSVAFKRGLYSNFRLKWVLNSTNASEDANQIGYKKIPFD